MYPYNKILTQFAKELRKNMTPEEKHLWYDFLKLLPMTVKRQYVVGNYILDFFIPEVNLAIELDGSQHYEEKNREEDKVRDETLLSVGIKVVRYPNTEINKNFRGVLVDLMKKIGIFPSDLKKQSDVR
jgi:very-short-patch-repair endonuclease